MALIGVIVCAVYYKNQVGMLSNYVIKDKLYNSEQKVLSASVLFFFFFFFALN